MKSYDHKCIHAYTIRESDCLIVEASKTVPRNWSQHVPTQKLNSFSGRKNDLDDLRQQNIKFRELPCNSHHHHAPKFISALERKTGHSMQ